MADKQYALAKPLAWKSLSPESKLAVLRHLTASELREASQKNEDVAELAQQIVLEKQLSEDSPSFLSEIAVVWALNQDKFFRRMIPITEIVPNEVSIGKKIGSGGTN